MTTVKSFFKGFETYQILLTVIFAIYIIFDIKTPVFFQNSIIGNLLVVVLAISIFMNSNPVLGILAVLGAYQYIMRSVKIKMNYPLTRYDEKEKTNVRNFIDVNQFPQTLEEEMVHNMAPLVSHAPAENSDYLPVMNNIDFTQPSDI